jgi:hypothetical protein
VLNWRSARPIAYDRTRPVIKKSLENLTGVDLTRFLSVSSEGRGASGHGMLAAVECTSGRWGAASGHVLVRPVVT